MDVVWSYAKDTVMYVLGTLLHNAPVLIIGILLAAAMQVYVNTDRLKGWLMKRSSVSIPASVAFGAFTPFCACGTMAVVISMLATALPWGPVMAFLTSSPLMSPDGFVLLSGIISPIFAIAVAAASVIIGVGSGYITHLIEKKTHFLDNQLRLLSAPAASAASCGCGGDALSAKKRVNDSASDKATVRACGCGSNEVAAVHTCGCGGGVIMVEQPCGCGSGATAVEPSCGCGSNEAAVAQTCGCAGNAAVRPGTGVIAKLKLGKLAKAAFDLGIKRILPYFMAFAAVGFLINRLIPAEWISALFGSKSIFSVPLAAVIGLPLYVNGDSSIPMIQSLMQSGVAPGAMLAFLITGPGTSAGVMAGIATIMKKKALGLYIAFLLAGAILLGYAYELILALAA